MSAARPAAQAADQPSPPNAWRRYLAHWTQRRHPPSDSQQLGQRTIYVLPTKAGWLLGLTLLLLLLASINFQLNLGYLLTFWLLATALMSVRNAHRNLRGLQLHLGTLEPVFQHQNAAIALRLQSAPQQQRARYALGLALSDAGGGPLAWSHVDVPAGQTQTATLGMTAQQRGWQRVPRVRVQSFYPLGVFRLWSYWQPRARLLVYPAPETPCPPVQQPDSDWVQHGSPQAHSASGAQAQDGVRPYQRGDRLADIVWKKSAPALATGSGDLVVRSGQSSPPPQLWLDARATGLAQTEAQIARLTAWVLHAQAQGSRWGLRLPSGASLGPDSGPQHLQACLRALALDGLPDEEEG